VDDRIKEQLAALEKLLRDADDRLERVAPSLRVRARRQRNAINAACNAMFRAARA
jgi:hypothetical protein